jgi:hypothetical protein
MKQRSSLLRAASLGIGIVIVFGCATIMPKSDSYKLSDAYLTEVRDNEDPLVMEYFYELNDYLTDGDYEMVVETATEGIDSIPKYADLFAYFYAMRSYASIMLYSLDAGREDIGNLTRFDGKSSMIPGLWAYYYFSYAPFDPDPKSYYLKAKDAVVKWRAAPPGNVFEQVFSDPARIANLSTVIDEELRK